MNIQNKRYQFLLKLRVKAMSSQLWLYALLVDVAITIGDFSLLLMYPQLFVTAFVAVAIYVLYKRLKSRLYNWMLRKPKLLQGAVFVCTVAMMMNPYLMS